MNSGTRKQTTRSGGKPQRASRLSVLLVVALGGVLLAVGGWLAWQTGRSASVAGSASSAGSARDVATVPKILIDRDVIDFGQVPVGQMVKATFKVGNGGDLPLQILGDPRVELVTGC